MTKVNHVNIGEIARHSFMNYFMQTVALDITWPNEANHYASRYYVRESVRAKHVPFLVKSWIDVLSLMSSADTNPEGSTSGISGKNVFHKLYCPNLDQSTCLANASLQVAQ